MKENNAKVQLLNGPLHGTELNAVHGGRYLDFLDPVTGAVRRYSRPSYAVFVKEWPAKEDYDKEGVELESLTE